MRVHACSFDFSQVIAIQQHPVGLGSHFFGLLFQLRLSPSMRNGSGKCPNSRFQPPCPVCRHRDTGPYTEQPSRVHRTHAGLIFSTCPIPLPCSAQLVKKVLSSYFHLSHKNKTQEAQPHGPPHFYKIKQSNKPQEAKPVVL